MAKGDDSERADIVSALRSAAARGVALMGTSSDYTGGTTADWESYKHVASKFASRGGDGRAEQVLARYVRALGGAPATAADARRAGVAPSQRVAAFGASLATIGLTATLYQLGLGHVVGGSRWAVLDGLLQALGGDGGTLEDQAVNEAVVGTLVKLYPAATETYEELEHIALEPGSLTGLVEQFVGRWAYARLLPTLAEKLCHIEDPAALQRRYAELRGRLNACVRLEIGGPDAVEVNWRRCDGGLLLGRVIDELYADMARRGR